MLLRPGAKTATVYDVVEQDGVVCDCRFVLLSCCGFTGASSVGRIIMALAPFPAFGRKHCGRKKEQYIFPH